MQGHRNALGLEQSSRCPHPGKRRNVPTLVFICAKGENSKSATGPFRGEPEHARLASYSCCSSMAFAQQLLREWTGESCFIGEQLFMENRNHVVIQGAVAGASKMLAPWESPATSLNAELSSVGWGSGSRRCNQLPADGDAAT